MKYSAIDLHSNNNVLVVSDETDRVLVEKRLPNELSRILALLEPHRSELAGVARAMQGYRAPHFWIAGYSRRAPQSSS